MRKIMIVLFVVIFLAGLSILLYPVVTDFFNSRRQAQEVERYFEAVRGMSQHDLDEMFEAAHEYNERLRRRANRFVMSPEDEAEYRSLLDPLGLGAIGTLEIDFLDIHLTIFHGTDEGVLQVGLGHLEGSSLPVGGPGTHAVITGHRGLPSSTLLTNLDRMVVGDMFKINVLNETLVYMVESIVIVLPHETRELAIVPDADYCTLLTCTPYGINTHRLLVRGIRLDGEVEIIPEHIPSGARVLPGARAAILLIIPGTLALLVILFIQLRRVYGRGKKR